MIRKHEKIKTAAKNTHTTEFITENSKTLGRKKVRSVAQPISA